MAELLSETSASASEESGVSREDGAMESRDEDGSLQGLAAGSVWLVGVGLFLFAFEILLHADIKVSKMRRLTPSMAIFLLIVLMFVLALRFISVSIFCKNAWLFCFDFIVALLTAYHAF